MRNSKTPVRLLLAVLALTAWGTGNATEVYRWTDADGVVHFSQTPPPSEADADMLRLRDPQPRDEAQETDIYDVAGQQARMQALREERERKRQERLERQHEEASRSAVEFRDADEYRYPGWWLRPNPPVRPVQPIERPPVGPGDPIQLPGMITPPRPLTPSGG